MLGPVNGNRGAPKDLQELTVGMRGVNYDGATRNKLWPLIDRAMKMNNPETAKKLDNSEAPTLEQLAKMTYHPFITDTNSGGLVSYAGFHDGKNLYVAASSGGLSGPRQTKWTIVFNLEMPPASRPAFG